MRATTSGLVRSAQHSGVTPHSNPLRPSNPFARWASVASHAPKALLPSFAPLPKRPVALSSQLDSLACRQNLTHADPGHTPLSVGRARSLRCTTHAAASTPEDPSEYIRSKAAIDPPPLLPTLVKVLQAQGETVVQPSERAGLHPLVIPLSKSTIGITGILRWPQSLGGPEMPVVRCGKLGLTLLANSAAEYIHRALVEEDMALGGEGPTRAACGGEAQTMYAVGAIKEQKRPEVYLVQKVGKFADIMEQLARGHLSKGDDVSALVTAEWMTGHMLDWGYAPAFHAKMLSSLNRNDEARDQARVSLCSPWWTLGHNYAEMADLAGFAGKDPQWVRDAVMGETTMREAQKMGVVPGQVERSKEDIALDQAGSLLDLASVTGDYDAIRDDLVQKYKDAGLNKVAFFVSASIPKLA